MGKVYPKFKGEYVDGKVKLDLPLSYDRYLKANMKDGQRVSVVVKKYYKRRSTGSAGDTGNQNGYYWGVVLPLIAEHSGHTPDELHEIYKTMFAPKKRYKMPNGKSVVINKSTGDMHTLEFSEYVEKIRAHAAEMGITIPEPNEAGAE